MEDINHKDEASELADLATSADSKVMEPTTTTATTTTTTGASSSSCSCGGEANTMSTNTTQPCSPATGTTATASSASPNTPLDSDSNSTTAVPTGSAATTVTPPGPGQLARTSSTVSEDYLHFLGRPGHVEKRFPVDRKKLEKLITEGGQSGISAEDFFKNIQESTSTLVLWPSRLKIGAKSKKDPQVKVIGLPANIQQARELILTDLDAKSTRATLKIDVAFSEHSHVIGKEGVNIKRVHNETKCHIHFPDSNRSNHGGERSNQVSITGQAHNVEIARRKIRELLPAVVTFALPLPVQSVDANSPDIQHMMLQYNVTIHLKPQPRQFSLHVVVRGTMKCVDGMKLAVSGLVEYFTGDCHLMPMVSLGLEVPVQHHHTLIGSNGGNVRKIMNDTSTTIQFPDPQSRYLDSQVVVTGTVDNVFKAREQLLGCLPAVLMFDVHESDENILSSSMIGDLMQQLDLFISVKAKKGQLQSVMIKSLEQNIHCMYKARTHLLEYSYQPAVVTSPLSSTSHPTPPAATSPPQLPITPFVPSTTSPLPPPTSATPPRNVSPKPVLKELPSVKEVKSTDKSLERRVSFKTDIEVTSEPTHQPVAMETTPEVPEEVMSPRTSNHTSPPPTETTRTSGAGQRSAGNTPVRLTTRQFLDYDRKREQAQMAMKSKVEPHKVRYPTPKYAGNYFSESMPVSAHDLPKTPPSPSATPQGLSSINRTSFGRPLMKQASQERAQLQETDQLDLYRDVTDLSTLLSRLSLEHYLNCFQQEEVDLDTFLTMSEADLKEVGVTTLGARRKLQIAISEMKKLQNKPPVVAAALPRSTASLGRSSSLFRSTTGSLVPSNQKSMAGAGINRSASLSGRESSAMMSRSGRF